MTGKRDPFPMTPARQPHPQRCETCNKRETLQCPIQDEDVYYKIKREVTVPTGWEILTSCIGCASHSSARPHPAPAHSGCDGCRKEIEHLECPTPGHCDQMKCVLCCEGSDFPTLPEEIKKYEAAAAKAEREDALALLEEWDYHNNRNFGKPHPMFADMIRLVREKPDEIRKHLESLRESKEVKKS
jgi:hypothetical protein